MIQATVRISYKLAVLMALGVLSLLPLLAWSAPLEKSPQSLQWQPYQNQDLHFTIKLPKQWKVLEKGNVVGFTSPSQGPSYGAMGIMKSSKRGISIQEAARQDIGASLDSKSSTQITTRLGGFPAVKVVTTPKSDPTRKLVQYYVRVGEDLFLVQCVGPSNQWAKYSALFATMIRTFQFSPQ